MAEFTYSGLLSYCRAPLGRDGGEGSPGLFEYAAREAARLLSAPADLRLFAELRTDVYEAVFAGRKSVRAITARRYKKVTSHRLFANLENCVFLDCVARGKAISVCRAEKRSNGAIAFAPPARLRAELTDPSLPGARKVEKRLRRGAAKPSPLGERLIRRRLAPLKMRTISDLMRSAQSDRRFLARYNEETFFRGIVVGKRVCNDADLFYFFTSDSFNRVLDLYQKPVRTAFAALYFISGYNFELKDVYSVGSVFSGEDQALSRENEKKRSEATSELITVMKRGNEDEILSIAARVGLRLLGVELPPLDVNETTALADNYTLYAGVTNLGACFIAATAKCRGKLERKLGADAERIYAAARFMSGYSKVLAFCDNLTKPENCGGMISEAPGYKEAALVAKIAGKAKYVGEVKL